MQILFSKYQGAGNDFILIDNRKKNLQLNTTQIKLLCDRHFGIGADGLMLLENTNNRDFKMIYFNSDGNQSTMCGNGGRCIVSYAQRLGIIHQHATFEAIDGKHYAEILKNNNVRLQMQNVTEIKVVNNGHILNTGSPHFVHFVKDINTINVYEEGKKIRHSEPFKTQGINVNFVQIKDKNNILVRTYERGVENETLACGTGVTTAAIVTAKILQTTKDKINITAIGGQLQIEFEYKNNTYQNIFLTGNAEPVFNGEIII